eukprot:UN21823
MSGTGCAHIYTPLPDGWEISPFSNDILSNVVRVYGWGTRHIMMLTGGRFYTAYSPSWGQTDFPDYEIKTCCGSDPWLYKVLVCRTDILIRKPCYGNLYHNFIISITDHLVNLKEECFFQDFAQMYTFSRSEVHSRVLKNFVQKKFVIMLEKIQKFFTPH